MEVVGGRKEEKKRYYLRMSEKSSTFAPAKVQ